MTEDEKIITEMAVYFITKHQSEGRLRMAWIELSKTAALVLRIFIIPLIFILILI